MTADLEHRIHAEVLADPPDRRPARVRELAAALAPLAGSAEREAVIGRVLARLHGLGPLETLLADPEVTDVLVNAGREVWVERRGRLERVDRPLAPGAAELLVERVVAPLGLRADRSSPVVDARLPDGSRVHVVVPPVAVDGPCLAIRRFGARAVPLSAFAGPAVVAALTQAVTERRNLVIAGGTGSGKTTLLNALAGVIPADERVITIEDAAELRLPGPHVVRLEARPPSPDGLAAVPVRALVRAALRMRPDRIVVGEVRGGEALDMVQAMNTGHEGSLSTVHANGPLDALRRLETMVLLSDVALPLDAVRDQLHASIDLLVQVARLPDGSRRVVELAEVAEAAEPDRPRVRSLLTADGTVDPFTRPPRGWSR